MNDMSRSPASLEVNYACLRIIGTTIYRPNVYYDRCNQQDFVGLSGTNATHFSTLNQCSERILRF